MLSEQYIHQISLRRENIDSFADYPYNLPVIQHLDDLALHPKVTFLVGENGAGKSTLLEALAVALGFNPEGGTKNFNFNTYASHSDLHDNLRIARGIHKPKDGFFFRAESFYNVATEIENLNEAGGPPLINSYGGRSLHAQSHGESFFALIMNRFCGESLYILDEPEAALSPQRQLAVLTRMHQLVQQGSQFIIATHAPILMAYPDAWIYWIDEFGIAHKDYKDTQHYQIMRDFVNQPERMLSVLLGE
ncbi:MAG: AAA family ATPase [Anaerolineaceae bacterium]|nr:AAA family ATPase [Anaerolineaceae bacterium]